MLKDDVLAAFLEEYEADMQRLDAATASVRPEREVELSEIERDIATIKTAILKGVDASMFVAEIRQLETRRQVLEAELGDARAEQDTVTLLHSDLRGCLGTVAE